MLIKETRTKRKVYDIILRSTDNTWISPVYGSPWAATWIVNMNQIMSQEELARPYYLSFTFMSNVIEEVPTITNVVPIEVFVRFNSAQNYQHAISSDTRISIGMLKFFSNNDPNQLHFGLEAKTNDNEPIYINNLVGCQSLFMEFVDISEQQILPAARFLMRLHLTPADY
jgi:hypothetical protein